MKRFGRLVSALDHRALPTMTLLALTIFIFPSLPSFPHLADAQSPSGLPPFVGRVCIVPGESTACPQTLPRILGGSPGSKLNVSINILGSSNFNQFNIRVRSDPTVVNVTGVDFAGTILPGPTSILQCVNGGGGACGTVDGPGVVSVNVTGGNTIAPVSGRLFKISYIVGSSSVRISIGFQTGCSPTSVPNSSVCVLIIESGSSGFTFLPEATQSQLLGAPLPTALASALPPGNITANLSGGIANGTDTFVLPYPVSLPGNITTWKVQFDPYQVGGINFDVAGIQIKVFRHINATTLAVVGAGLVHDPRPILQSRLPSYPLVKTEWTVIQYYADRSIAVQPGDLIGLSIINPPGGVYMYPAVNASGTRYVNRNVPLGGMIDLGVVSTFTVPNGWGPALQVSIQLPPPVTDTAGDGIPDFVKLSPEMLALGADPCRKTVAVQMDYMVPPLPDAIKTVVQSFDAAPVPANVTSCPYPGFPSKPSGIKLILDVKNQIPKQDYLNFTHSEPMSFETVKATYFDPNRVLYFHYGIFAHSLAPLGTRESTISGVAEIFGSNFMVTLGEWPNGGSVSEQAGTIMHELGHNLGLDHGGGNAVNFKTNYLSVMNYAFQVVGITRQTSSGNVTRFDFSSQALPPLNESSLDEATTLSNSNDFTRWVCPGGRHVKIGLAGAPMDYDCNSTIDNSRVSVNINNDTSFETLTGYNDWANLRYKFTQSDSFSRGCRTGCDIGCRTGCDIGCRTGCDIGTELDFPDAAVIEAQWTAFFASPHHSTLTSVSCNPSNIPLNSPSTCTATETDSSTVPVTPTGIVSFRSSQTGSFTPTAECTLLGTGSSATCSVTYTPGSSNLGSQTISAFYPGDIAHLASSGSTTVAGFVPIITIMTTTTLKTDFTGQIVIGADGIDVNCDGHTISGVSTASTASPNSGILLNGRSGVTIENCHVANFYIGFQLVSSNGTTLTADSATGNGFGFLLSSSNNNLLSGDTATGNKLDGFLLQSSGNNNLLGDTANGNSGSGFRLVSSSNNNLQKNTASNNSVYGFALTSSSNNNSVIGNSACGNIAFDAFQSGSTGNKFKSNAFCTTSGI